MIPTSFPLPQVDKVAGDARRPAGDAFARLVADVLAGAPEGCAPDGACAALAVTDPDGPFGEPARWSAGLAGLARAALAPADRAPVTADEHGAVPGENAAAGVAAPGEDAGAPDVAAAGDGSAAAVLADVRGPESPAGASPTADGSARPPAGGGQSSPAGDAQTGPGPVVPPADDAGAQAVVPERGGEPGGARAHTGPPAPQPAAQPPAVLGQQAPPESGTPSGAAAPAGPAPSALPATGPPQVDGPDPTAAHDGASRTAGAHPSGEPVSGPPASTSAGQGTPTAPLSSSLAARIAAAVEVLENAPPPQRLTLDLGDARVTVALRADGVHVTVLPGHASGFQQGWQRDVATALAAKGFAFSGGDEPDGRREHHERPDEPHARPAPRRQQTPRAAAGLRL